MNAINTFVRHTVKMAALRAQGLTFAEIDEALGFDPTSKNRAYDFARMAKTVHLCKALGLTMKRATVEV